MEFFIIIGIHQSKRQQHPKSKSNFLLLLFLTYSSAWPCRFAAGKNYLCAAQMSGLPAIGYSRIDIRILKRGTIVTVGVKTWPTVDSSFQQRLYFSHITIVAFPLWPQMASHTANWLMTWPPTLKNAWRLSYFRLINRPSAPGGRASP